MNCRICGRVSEGKRVCRSCIYLLRHGADELSIRRMLSDDVTMKIWKENEKTSKELAEVYYESLIDAYDASEVKRNTKEDFGYNTFADGIRLGLDVIMPLVDEDSQLKIKEKIKSMIELRMSKR